MEPLSSPSSGAPFHDIVYGDGSQASTRFVRLHRAPDAETTIHGTVVILHGGYWKNAYGLDDAYNNAGVGTLAPYFLERGFSAVEIEYRRRDHEGGGWPGTNEDVLAAMRHLVALGSMDGCGHRAAVSALRLDRLILVGHSAGGCLALWLAHQLCGGAVPGCSVALVLAAAPVADLARGYELKVGDEGAEVERYMGCTPLAEPAAYQAASPAALLPLHCATLTAYGDADEDVPPLLCEEWCVKAAAESPAGFARNLCIAGANHFDVVNAEHAAWIDHIVPQLADMLQGSGDDAAAAALLGPGK